MKKLICSLGFIILLMFLLTCNDSNENPVEIIDETEENESFELPDVTQYISNVNLDTLKNFVECLTGEKQVFVDGDYVEIKTRHWLHHGNALAREYINGVMTSYGYDVEIRNPYGNSQNILAVKEGTNHPDKFYLIGAHYDSMPDSSVAPGADDNASGTALVLEAARILRNYQSSYSIIFAFWDEEEAASGSKDYAKYARDSGINILEVFNIDMIGWDSDNDGTMMAYRTNNGQGLDFENITSEINNEHNLQLNIIFRDTYNASDDQRFYQEGFNTIGFIEKFLLSLQDPDNDFNPYWHKSTDTVDKFNMEYFHKCSKLIIATLAGIAFAQN